VIPQKLLPSMVRRAFGGSKISELLESEGLNPSFEAAVRPRCRNGLQIT